MLKALPLALLLSANAYAGYIEVSGQAAMELIPTNASITSSIEVTAKDPVAAKQQADAVIAKVLKAFEQQGIDGRQYKAGHLQLGPRYDYRDNKRELLGYEANRQVQLMVPVADVGQWLAQFAELGLTQISAPDYQTDMTIDQRAELLSAALADARNKAEVLANASGQRLGEVEQIEEVGSATPRPMVRMAMANAESYQPGTEAEQLQLRVRFELED